MLTVIWFHHTLLHSDMLALSLSLWLSLEVKHDGLHSFGLFLDSWVAYESNLGFENSSAFRTGGSDQVLVVASLSIFFLFLLFCTICWIQKLLFVACSCHPSPIAESLEVLYSHRMRTPVCVCLTCT